MRHSTKDTVIRPVSKAAFWHEKITIDDMTDEDMSAFQIWLEEDPDNEWDFAECSEIWAASESFDFWSAVEHQEGAVHVKPVYFWKNIQNRKIYGIVSAMAACLLILFLLRPYGYSGQIYETDVGEQRVVVLADGSRVHLNTATRLNVNYSDQKRDISLLAGEAFFDVAKDAMRPFEVAAGHALVRAIGTHFYVRTEKGQVQVTVTEGRVEVSSPQSLGEGESPLKLIAGQQLNYDAAGVISPVRKMATKRAIAWRSGNINFSGTPLTEVLAEINRYTKTPIIIGDERLKEYKVSGAFRIDEIDTLIDGLEHAFPIVALRKDGKIILVAKNTKLPINPPNNQI
ncbi:MAG: hypothetical protein COB36_10355 [Alphaproteobacteria bacterium]|nr:MAG: hypothetical protein COB36_10355 [Alphaproteobacteria bacterium]